MDVLPGVYSSDNIVEIELKEIILNSIPNGCSNKSYFQVFHCETITLKSVDMFETMEIDENIYEGVVEPFIKKHYIIL